MAEGEDTCSGGLLRVFLLLGCNLCTGRLMLGLSLCLVEGLKESKINDTCWRASPVKVDLGRDPVIRNVA